MNIYKIIRYSEKIPCDKRMHFMIGVIFTSLMSMAVGLNLAILALGLLFVAYGIEVFQKITKSGKFDHYDAIAVIVGGLVVILPIILSKG